MAVLYLLPKNKEVAVLREDQLQLIEMKNEVTRLRGALQSAKTAADRVAELELIIAQLTVDLEKEKNEKQTCLTEIETIQKEKNKVRIYNPISYYVHVILYLLYVRQKKMLVTRWFISCDTNDDLLPSTVSKLKALQYLTFHWKYCR